MKYILIFFFFITGCSSSKTVLICGDHACVNKKEANQYFDNNLTLEIKVINNKKEQYFDLVKLNLKDSKNKEEISVYKKKNRSKKLKILSKNEIINKKKEVDQVEIIKKKKVNRKVNLFNKVDKKNSLKNNKKLTTKSKHKNTNKTINSNNDICIILKKCDIDQISKYLNKLGEDKSFPKINIK